MKRIYIIITAFLVFFIAGLLYFFLSINKSFKTNEEVIMEIKKDSSKQEPFESMYYYERT